jgi:transcriptional regulator with XRE-family HTH domain
MRVRKATWFEDLKAKLERDPEHWAEYLQLVFSEEVGRLLDDRRMTRTDLARRMDASKAYITKLFRASANPTFLTVAKVALALDARVSLHLHPVETSSHWMDIPVHPEIPTLSSWPLEEGLLEPLSTPEGDRCVDAVAA